MTDLFYTSSLTLVIHVQGFSFKAQAIAWLHAASGETPCMPFIPISLEGVWVLSQMLFGTLDITLDLHDITN